MATNKQRTAFSKCVDAMERVNTAIERMAHTGSPRSRGRVINDQQDLHKLAEQEEQFESALSAMIAHQTFVGELNDTQKSGLDR